MAELQGERYLRGIQKERSDAHGYKFSVSGHRFLGRQSWMQRRIGGMIEQQLPCQSVMMAYEDIVFQNYSSSNTNNDFHNLNLLACLQRPNIALNPVKHLSSKKLNSFIHNTWHDKQLGTMKPYVFTSDDEYLPEQPWKLVIKTATPQNTRVRYRLHSRLQPLTCPCLRPRSPCVPRIYTCSSSYRLFRAYFNTAHVGPISC